MYDMLKAPNLAQQCVPRMGRCGLCGVSRKPFRILSKGSDDTDDDRPGFVEDLREKVTCLTLLANLMLKLPDILIHNTDICLSWDLGYIKFVIPFHLNYL